MDISCLLLLKYTSLWKKCPRARGLVCVILWVENNGNGTLLGDILYPVLAPGELIEANKSSCLDGHFSEYQRSEGG